MDWLEAFSPMKIHWLQRWISLPYGRSTAVLHGISPTSQDCQLLQLFLVSPNSPGVQSEAVHPDVQPILTQFEHLFAEPTDLPPRRDCDHKIPLVPGTTPVSVRQYRYSPTLKTEIENQVSEMLQTGFIRPSSSAFSSPILMVRKKDGGWQMCVDYRLLNSLAVESKFPIPVIDELLDELAGAQWFTSLDLRAGFN
jgi:hypothetical protein